MQRPFQSRPGAIADSVLIIVIGVGVMALLEAEKAIVPWIGRRREGPAASSV